MKTLKSLVATMLLLFITTSLFAGEPGVKFSSAMTTLHSFKSNAVSAYYVRTAIHRLNDGTNNVTIYVYITDDIDTTTPLVVPGNFSVSVDVTSTGGTNTNYYTILAGNSYTSSTTSVAPGTPLSLSNAVFSTNSYNGLPIYPDYTIHYF